MRKKTIILFLIIFNIIYLLPQGFAVTNPSSKTNKHSVKNINKLTDGLGQNKKNAKNQDIGIGGLGTFVETLIILALFVVGIYGIFRFIQKKRGGGFGSPAVIKVISSTGLGGNRMLQIVEVGSKIFLIGVTDNTINLLSEIDDKETIDWLRLEYSRQPQKGAEGFLEKLTSFLGRAGNQVKPADNGEKIDFMKKQRDRLRKIKNK